MTATSRWLLIGSFAVAAAAGTALAQQPAGAATPADGSTAVRMDFDGVKAGALPAGWTVDATHRRGPLAVWKVAADPAAPSPPNVLDAIPWPGTSGATFNLCWTKGVSFLDGEIEVRLRANSGKGDEGGGPMWRVIDGDNYYVVRYNPLEHNFRLYTVRSGVRRMLEGASRIPILRGKWFTIRVAHHGDHIVCFLDGKKLLDVHDATFTKAGGAGLWTKADAATSFDDFVVRPAGK